jgi:uncharacterized protein YecT (DUF1311 family)
MIRRVSILVCGFVLCVDGASAQLTLPGAAPSAPAGAPATAPKPNKPKKSGAAKAGTSKSKAANVSAPDSASIAGRSLMLNGQAGLLQLSGSGGALQVDKLRLAGESVSDPSQRCMVDIVGEKPIIATSVGRPDGLERFEVDVPACPFAFDLLDGSVVVPPQITACVFKAADCQTSPGGLWGPTAADIEKDAAEITKRRSQAEKAMGKALQTLEERAKDNPDAANLVRDQNAFAGQRDDACRSYVKESALGYCAASLTGARAALLEARLAALLPASAAKTGKSFAGKKKKKKPSNDAVVQ